VVRPTVGRISGSEAAMTDRANSPAYQMLPRSARRVFAAIERAIGNGNGNGNGASYTDFRLDQDFFDSIDPNGHCVSYCRRIKAPGMPAACLSL
jgi:hypothetical protein